MCNKFGGLYTPYIVDIGSVENGNLNNVAS